MFFTQKTCCSNTNWCRSTTPCVDPRNVLIHKTIGYYQPINWIHQPKPYVDPPKHGCWSTKGLCWCITITSVDQIKSCWSNKILSLTTKPIVFIKQNHCVDPPNHVLIHQTIVLIHQIIVVDPPNHCVDPPNHCVDPPKYLCWSTKPWVLIHQTIVLIHQIIGVRSTIPLSSFTTCLCW